MMSRDYSATIEANVPVTDAFERISKVSEWWTKGFSGESSRIGDRFTVRFGDTFVDFTISELEPDTRIAWDVTDCNLAWIDDKTEWKGTRIVWELAPKNGATEVRMTHVGLLPDLECYDNCKGGWNFYVTKSLQKLLAENIGLPDGEPSRS